MNSHFFYNYAQNVLFWYSAATHVSSTTSGNTDGEIMRKLTELWEMQRDFLDTIQEASKNVTHLTGRQMKGIGWLFNDVEWLIERQLDELSTPPKTIKGFYLQN